MRLIHTTRRRPRRPPSIHSPLDVDPHRSPAAPPTEPPPPPGSVSTGRSPRRGALGVGGALWAIAGVAGILAGAIFRLADVALDALDQPLAWYHWAAMGAFVPFMAWSEGVRGFQRRFSPRVAERAMLIRAAPTTARVIFAPLFAAGFFGGSRRERVGICLGTAAIVVLVVLVHRLDQPWRGIIDAGVVAGLAWGMVTTLALSASAWRRAAAD